MNIINNYQTSILGYNWQQKTFDQRKAKAIYQRFALPEILSNLLSQREVDLDWVENFLEPKIKNYLPNPFDLGDVERAANYVVDAIKLKKKITIFADYDVDGATSSAALKRFFAMVGLDVGIYIPDRILEGYGPNSEALVNLKKSGTDLVITLDCGTVAFKPLEDAAKVGLDIIVIDHHLGVLEKPPSIAVINPNLLDEKFPHKNLCAAGVTFLFIVAVNKKLREAGYYKNNEPNLLNLLDLVALGTVCDVMSLTGLNRAFVDAGLKILKKRQNLGLRAICDLAGLNEEPSAYHLGFIIGPRINAGGRVGTSNLGAELLSTNDENKAQELALKLENLNKERKEIESQVLQEAITNLESGKDGFSKDDAVIFAVSNNWHQGVIGIVASRLKDLYNRPVAVITIDDNNQKAKASCRSINGIDFGAQILKARLEGLLIEGGGHAMAGGFSILPAKIKELQQFFIKNLSAEIEQATLQKIAEFDFALDLQQVNIEMLNQIARLEPFGVGNVRPKFILRDVTKIRANIIGKTGEHISAIFSAKTNAGFQGQIQAVAFRSVDNEVGKMLLDDKYNKTMNLVGTLNINSWRGIDKPQMIIEDIIL